MKAPRAATTKAPAPFVAPGAAAFVEVGVDVGELAACARTMVPVCV